MSESRKPARLPSSRTLLAAWEHYSSEKSEDCLKAQEVVVMGWAPRKRSGSSEMEEVIEVLIFGYMLLIS